MNRIYLAWALGCALLALVGFFSPVWYLGFLPLGAGLLWAVYDLIDVEDPGGDAPTAAR